jgi:hypothetical protein
MKIMMMMMIWETATSVFVKKKTTMKLSSLSQSYFHPYCVHIICILGTANKKRIEAELSEFSRFITHTNICPMYYNNIDECEKKHHIFFMVKSI